MKVLFFYGLAIMVGILIPVQAATNVILSKVTGHILFSSLILFGVGIISISILIVFLKPSFPSFDELIVAPLHSYMGGVIVAIYVLSITFLAPKIGVGNAVLFIVAGQLLSSALIDHYGLFGLDVLPLTTRKYVGIGCVIAGVLLVNYSPSPDEYR